MSMSLGLHFGPAGLLAFDTCPRIESADGTVRYDSLPFDRIRGTYFVPFVGGFACGGGTASTVLAGLEAMRVSRPGPTPEHAAKISRAMLEHVENGDHVAPYTAGDGAHPGWAEVAVLNAGPDGLELGFVRTDRPGWHPVGRGTVYWSSPGGTPRAAHAPAEKRLHEAVRAVLEGRATPFDCIRAVATFYADVACVDPTLSGSVHIGIITRSGADQWDGSLVRHTSAAALAICSDEAIRSVTSC